MKRPAFMFYPSDWRKDVRLHRCTLEARGLWLEMLCLMHEGEPYGHLAANGLQIPSTELARMLHVHWRTVARLLQELRTNGVLSDTPDGVIYSRRMVNDERVRNARAAGGVIGGEHGIKGREHGARGGRPRADETPLRGTPDEGDEGGGEGGIRKPPPSFAFAVSASAISEPLERGAELALAAPLDRSELPKANGKHAPAVATRLPERWQVPQEFLDYAINVRHLTRQEALEISFKFRDHYLSMPDSKAFRSNWLAAWRLWLAREAGDKPKAKR